MSSRTAFVLGLLAACAARPHVDEDVVSRELLRVLASGALDLPAQVAESVLVSSRGEWERVRRRAGFEALPILPCDFDSASVLLVIASASRGGASLRFRVSTEEGVDVVTAEAPADGAGEAAEPRSRALWLVVPARPRQLAVVLQEPGPRGALEERTLAVHAPRE